MQSHSLRKETLIGTAVIFLSVVFLTPGYSFGYGEQMLLSIKGISWADSNAFVGDWFNSQAPQPHILFDIITYIGEKIHFLEGVYLIYYLGSCFLFAAGSALLAELWLPKRLQYLQQVVNSLCVIGPYFVLGTFLNIHQQAVPNMAGGCIAYFSVACLLTKRDSWAAIAIILSSLFHLQHGLVTASVAILFVLLGLSREKIRLLSSSLIAITISFSIAVYRDLLSGSSEIANQIAEIGSTGHFNVETWPRSAIITGLVFLMMACLNFLLPTSSHMNKKVFFAFSLVGLAPVAGMVSDLADIEPIQSLTRSFFVYRYSMILAPFAGWFIVRNLSNFATARRRIAMISALLFIVSYQRFFQTTFTMTPHFYSPLIVLLLLLSVLPERIPFFAPTVKRFCPAFFLSLAFVFAMSISINQFGPRWPTLGFSATDDAVTLSRSMATTLTPKDVLASDPSIPWIRPFTRRAIVVDCKGIPYGGPPWFEYSRRLRALGVTRPDQCVGYNKLSLEEIKQLPKTVGATTILLLPHDSSYSEAVKQLPVRWTGNQANPWIIFDLTNLK